MEDAEEYLNSLPVGYRFRPLDEELLIYYLRKKVKGERLEPNRIKEVDVYQHNPEQLIEIYGQKGESECYFFSSRYRRYKNGLRPSRTAGDGYWKASGVNREVVFRGETVGFKATLVFHKAKDDVKTDWLMNEYLLANNTRKRLHDTDMRLDDDVLYKVYLNKKGKQQQKKKKKEGMDEVAKNAIIPAAPEIQHQHQTSFENGGEIQPQPISWMYPTNSSPRFKPMSIQQHQHHLNMQQHRHHLNMQQHLYRLNMQQQLHQEQQHLNIQQGHHQYQHLNMPHQPPLQHQHLNMPHQPPLQHQHLNMPHQQPLQHKLDGPHQQPRQPHLYRPQPYKQQPQQQHLDGPQQQPQQHHLNRPQQLQSSFTNFGFTKEDVHLIDSDASHD